MSKFTWMKTYFSPFKPPKIRFYIGKIAVGTPYFFPRKWIKSREKPGYLTAIPKIIGFDFVRLGWKTKWDTYRFEWSPLWSFVFFKWQVAIMFIPNHQSHYWESWLYYELNTDKTINKIKRIEQCLKNAPQLWSSWNKETGEKITTNYYTKILKKKYLKLITDEVHI